MARTHWKKRAVVVFFTLWGGGVLTLGGALTALHSPVDPAEELDPAFGAHTARAMDPLPGEAWDVTHILDPLHCRCSAAVEAHLVKRGALPGLQETVVVLGGSIVGLGALGEAGFKTQVFKPGLEEGTFGVKSVPLMRIRRNQTEVLYFGGYYTTMAQTKNHDIKIIQDTLNGSHWDPLPSFGCARSRALQRAKDPFGLKYPTTPGP